MFHHNNFIIAMGMCLIFFNIICMSPIEVRENERLAFFIVCIFSLSFTMISLIPWNRLEGVTIKKTFISFAVLGVMYYLNPEFWHFLYRAILIIFILYNAIIF